MNDGSLLARYEYPSRVLAIWHSLDLPRRGGGFIFFQKQIEKKKALSYKELIGLDSGLNSLIIAVTKLTIRDRIPQAEKK